MTSIRPAAFALAVGVLALAVFPTGPTRAAAIDPAGPIVTAAATDPVVSPSAPARSPSPGVATAAAIPRTAATGDDVDRQIDAWVAAAPLSPADLATPAAAEPAPRAIHGQVTAGIGSHGYREVLGIADIPFGQTGVATVAVSDVRGDLYGFGRQHQQSLGLAISLGDPGRGGRGPACGPGGRFDSPLWARQFQADGYGAAQACEAAPGRGYR